MTAEEIQGLYILDFKCFDPEKYQDGAALAESLVANTSMTNLFLDNNTRYNRDGVLDLSHPVATVLIHHMGKLSKLTVSGSPCDVSELLVLILTHNPGIVELNLSYLKFNLDPLIGVMSNLTHLYLSDFKFDDMTAFGLMLQTNTSITMLGLYSDNSKAKNLDFLTDVIRHNTTLVELRISGHDFEDYEAFTHALARNQTLAAFQLKNSNLKTLDPFSQVLDLNTRLFTLDLGEGIFRKVGGFARALAGNTSLGCLNLYDSRMLEGANDVLEAGLKSESLVELTLDYSNITRIRYPQDLSTNTTLQKLDISNNFENIQGIEEFVDALATNTTLGYLDIDYTGFRNDGKIERILETNFSLTSLRYEGERPASVKARLKENKRTEKLRHATLYDLLVESCDLEQVDSGEFRGEILDNGKKRLDRYDYIPILY